MNKLFFLLAVSLISIPSFAQKDSLVHQDSLARPVKSKFVLAMEKQIAILDTATVPSTLQTCYNGFERLANVEKGEWLPDYYMAFCLLMESYSADTKKIDDYCDQADLLLNRADSLSPNNAEIYVLKSISSGARIRVNPMSRGAKYGKQSSILLQQAQGFDSLNPRVDFTQAQGIFYTPPAFGGGKDRAKPYAESAVRKFGTFVPKSSIHPHWGKDRAEKLLSDCNK